MTPPVLRFIDAMCKHYRTEPGWNFHTVRNPLEPVTSGNHHVINAVMHKMTCWLGYPGLYNQREMMWNADLFIMKSIDFATGEFNRAPTKFEDQEHDDLIAIAASSKRLLLPYAQKIYDMGQRWRKVPVRVLGITIKIPFRWYFDNTEETPFFEWGNWLFRFFWFKGFIKACADKRLSVIDRIALSIYFLTGLREEKGSISGRQLRYLMTDILWEKKHRSVNWAIRKWMIDQKRTYSGWGEAMGIYHQPSFVRIGDQGSWFDHPFSEFGGLAFENEFQKNLGNVSTA